jgi:hypothetical protein
MQMSEKTKTEAKTESHKDPARLRRCLLCGEKFGSTGPHNRICKRCKSSQVWRQG